MPEPTIDELLTAESRLDNSFAACAAAFLAHLAWIFIIMALGGRAHGWTGYVYLTLVLTVIGTYIWFAASAARAARGLGKRPLLYLAWVLGAPLLGAVIGIPIVSAVISASPLSLKWLLGSELRATIAARTLSE